MNRDLSDVWVEGQIDNRGIAISLISEGNSGARVESVEHFTFDELENMQGELVDLNLSDESRSAIVGETVGNSASRQSGWNLPEVGDIVRDTHDQPHWSDEDRLRVIEVTDIPARNYDIGEYNLNRNPVTVADKNPDEPKDAPVVVANYLDSDTEYSFPCTRLEQLSGE